MKISIKVCCMVLAVLMVFSLTTASCSNIGRFPEPEQEKKAADTMRLKLYFATNDGSRLVPEIRVVPKNDRPARAALELLLVGPVSRRLVNVFPGGTNVKRLSVYEGVAYVDLSEAVIHTPNRGSIAETIMVASIVNTLTEFPDIHAVQILVEGQHVEAIYGHLDVSQPLNRFENLLCSGNFQHEMWLIKP